MATATRTRAKPQSVAERAKRRLSRNATDGQYAIVMMVEEKPVALVGLGDRRLCNTYAKHWNACPRVLNATVVVVPNASLRCMLPAAVTAR